MKCLKCNEELKKGTNFCPNCGQKVEKEEDIKKDDGSLYCPKCGQKVDKNIIYCPVCGQKVDGSKINNPNQRSKIGAGLLGIFIGYLGVHNFYLGYTSKGIAQILLTTIGIFACGLGPIISWTWGLVEGILILTGSINLDADGNRLQD